MPWNPTVIDSEILAIHAALVPSGGDGEVVLFGGDEHWQDQQEPGGNFRKTRVYDVRSHTIVNAAIESPDSDVFCSGHSFTLDGRLLIVGGTQSWTTGHGHHLDFAGHRRCWLYNAHERNWNEAAQLLPDPNGNGSRGGGRWYPGSVTMANGEVLALFGHVLANDSRHRNATPERYNVNVNSWQPMSKLANDATNYQPFAGSPIRFLFYARTFQLPDGRLFFATPMPVNWASNTSNDPNPTDGDHFSSFYDPTSGAYVGSPISEPSGYNAWSFPCVLLPLLPTENYRARVMHCGRTQSMRIDLGTANPTWQSVNTALGVHRVNSCAVLLPTGEVCLVGGVENELSDGGRLIEAELYNPGINWDTGLYELGLGTWTADANLPRHSRNYHSAALLLPNGSVLTCGGNKNAQAGDPTNVGIKKIELFTPAYAAGARPAISNVPRSATYGQQFNVTVSNAADVHRVALIRNGSCTHAYDFDQRYVGVLFAYNPGNGHIRVTMPPNSRVAPPGYYMLWVIDSAGRPCQLAKFVRLGFQSCRVVTNRSRFSREEVEALGAGGAANFSDATYVQFDGCIHTEIVGTPHFDIRWDDTNAPVDPADFTLTGGVRLQEVNPGSPDIPQRITFAFNAVFPTLNAYATFTDTRWLRVTYSLGEFTAIQRLELSYSPNPYLIDVNAAQNNPSWLSTDVRVFSIEAEQFQFGDVLQGRSDPIGFIQRCLDKLNNSPNGNSLFEALSTDATLSLASSGPLPSLRPLFNYAIARVRYRARTTTANRVKCFFRTFNTAVTGLDFDPSTNYRRTAVGPDTVPLLGTAGGEVASIPFFASPRVETVQGQPGANAMAAQVLDSTYEVRNITPNASGAEVTAFFGCWLDINETRKRIPITPGSSDGPWPAASCRSIQELMRGRHTCIVGEIFFEPDLTRIGDSPDTSDNLSQRNLTILGSDNPGGPDSHTVMHTFEIKPSLFRSPTEGQPSDFFAIASKGTPFDELLFRWHNLPPKSEVTLYFSDISMREIQALASFRQSPLACEIVDDNTLKLPVGGLTWLPIPGGRKTNIPALLSFRLPDTVKTGEVFRVTIHQVSADVGRVVGSSEFRIEVSKAEVILAEEARTLSVFKHIARSIPDNNRWFKLMQRYIHHMGVRVDALGGNSKKIFGNPDGSGKPYEPQKDQQQELKEQG